MFAITDETRCYASRFSGTMIDVIHPETGLTLHFSKDLAAVRADYPDAEEMSVGEWCAWKAEQQRSPITWAETTRARFYDALECLPPAAGTKGYRAFLLGEPYDHDAGNGQPRYQGYRRDAAAYLVSSRPMTVAEFRAEVGDTL
jgi:hypothetical protein